MTTLGRTALTLAILTALALSFGAGWLTNGYVTRGEALAAYNGANAMREAAVVETERAREAEQSVVTFFRSLGESEENAPLPQETPAGVEAGRELSL